MADGAAVSLLRCTKISLLSASAHAGRFPRPRIPRNGGADSGGRGRRDHPHSWEQVWNPCRPGHLVVPAREPHDVVRPNTAYGNSTSPAKAVRDERRLAQHLPCGHAAILPLGRRAWSRKQPGTPTPALYTQNAHSRSLRWRNDKESWRNRVPRDVSPRHQATGEGRGAGHDYASRPTSCGVGAHSPVRHAFVEHRHAARIRTAL